VIVRITEFKQQGAWKLDEVREQIRARLAFEKSYERFVDELRREVYVDIRY